MKYSSAGKKKKKGEELAFLVTQFELILKLDCSSSD